MTTRTNKGWAELNSLRELTDLLLEMFWCQRQITVGKAENFEAHICCEPGQHQFHIRLILIPVRNTIYGEGVSEVSKAWLAGRTVRS